MKNIILVETMYAHNSIQCFLISLAHAMSGKDDKILRIESIKKSFKPKGKYYNSTYNLKFSLLFVGFMLGLPKICSFLLSYLLRSDFAINDYKLIINKIDVSDEFNDTMESIRGIFWKNRFSILTLLRAILEISYASSIFF